MELLTPHSEEDSQAIFGLWKDTKGVPKNVHVGLTMKGTDEKWYEAHTGKVVNFDLEWEKTESIGKRDCMSLENYPRGAVGYSDQKCIGTAKRFVCEHFEAPVVAG